MRPTKSKLKMKTLTELIELNDKRKIANKNTISALQIKRANKLYDRLQIDDDNRNYDQCDDNAVYNSYNDHLSDEIYNHVMQRNTGL